MTSEEKQQIKEKLLLTLEEIKVDIERLKDATKPVAPDNAIGRISRMDAINNKSVSEASLRAAKVKLEKLERNLKRIDMEDFGKCSRCGNDIRPARLLFMPETSWCIHCARRG